MLDAMEGRKNLQQHSGRPMLPKIASIQRISLSIKERDQIARTSK